jgi:hypothetical protein
MTRLRSSAATARQARLRSANFALRAAADAPSFGAAAQLRRRVVTTAAAVIFGGGSTVLACPVCFGAEESSMIEGTRLGILVLLAITLAVQGGFVGFFLYLRKRAKRMADVELDTEWSELQGAPKTS